MKQVEIDRLLYRVEKPARYLGNELNSVHKEVKEGMIRFAFCFPDIYEIGMSHLGMQIIYHLLNQIEDVYCERVFAPAVDMEQEMRANQIPLFGLESREPIEGFDFVGFTLQYELSYTNILNMLDLAGIPIYAAERDESHPLVIVGGPCSYNAEPIADFVDIVILGEAEEVLPDILKQYQGMKAEGYSKQAFLEAIAPIQGVYIPSFYQVTYLESGEIEKIEPINPHAPKKVKKRIIRNLDKVFYPEELIVPYLDVVHDRVMLEVFRGCTRGCRFCQAGMLYRPIRERSLGRLQGLAEKLLSSSGYEEVSLTSLSTSDYSQLGPLVRHLIDTYEKDKVGISLPSLRLDNFTFEIIQEIQRVRKTGLTFAPEAGSQRLRDVINKGITEEDLLQAMRKAFSLGWNGVKLYFMIGLPTETYEDLDGIRDLANGVLDVYYETVEKEKRGKGVNVTISASTFVPKPFTPFQWEPQDTLPMIEEKQRYLVEKLKRRNLSFNYHDSKTSVLEGVFARGDRRLSKVLAKALEAGCKFDGWNEHFSYERWLRVFEDCGIDPSFYNNRRREYTEVLPWDHIDPGVSKQFLMRENEKAKEGKLTVDCRTSCSACGINQGFIGGIC